MFASCAENETLNKAQDLSHAFATLTAHAALIAALASTLATADVELGSFLGVYSAISIFISLIITLAGLLTIFSSKFWSKKYGQLEHLNDFSMGADITTACAVICGGGIALSKRGMIPGTLFGNLGIASMAAAALVIFSLFSLILVVVLYGQNPTQEKVRFSLGAVWNIANSMLTIAGAGVAVLLSLQLESLSNYMWLTFAVTAGFLSCCKMGTAIRCCCVAQEYSEKYHDHTSASL